MKTAIAISINVNARQRCTAKFTGRGWKSQGALHNRALDAIRR
jgi:hypothetical protein